MKQTTTSKMIRCVLSHDSCEVIFFHEDLEHDKFFEEKVRGKMLKIFEIFDAIFYKSNLASKLPIGTFINDVTLEGGEEVSNFVTECDRRGRG